MSLMNTIGAAVLSVFLLQVCESRAAQFGVTEQLLKASNLPLEIYSSQWETIKNKTLTQFQPVTAFFGKSLLNLCDGLEQKKHHI